MCSSDLHRSPGPGYSVTYGKVPLEQVANSERTFPAGWIISDGRDVSDEFLRYATPLIGEDMVSLPLIGGRQRLARLQPNFVEKKLPEYQLEALRKKK